MASELIYRLQIALDSSFMDIVFYDTVEYVTSAQFETLEYATTYYWRVKSVDSFSGEESVWSSPCIFKTTGQDVTLQHSTSYMDFISIINNVATQRMCPKIGLQLSNLANREVPIGNDCTYVGLQLSALSGREVI